MKIFFSVLAIIMSVNIWAAFEVSRCTEWALQDKDICTFADLEAKAWSRQCQEPCHPKSPSFNCGQEKFCNNINPNNLRSNCTAWAIVDGVSCQSHRGEFEQQWERSCQYGDVSMTWCSDTNPN
ncbi:MAG: hypothetical protein HOO06_11585 [Bdellovibrionaceae bacterium]|jgi:hypothetical protein|nr:hypothetical protein [Pseudobdellovibrionaceae bacterium]